MNDRHEYVSDTAGERLDVFLARQRSEFSRSRIRRLIVDGVVAVDGRPAKPSTRLVPGQLVSLEVSRAAPPQRLPPREAPLSVVYEDDDLLVIDKPAGMVVHPGAGREELTLAHAALARAPEIEGAAGDMRPGIVHRLDRDTSGLVVVAKNQEAHAHISGQFERREVEKVYLALVEGHPMPPEAIVDAPIGRSPRDRQRMAIVSAGRDAVTRYRVLTRFARCSLVEARPKTGRTHQIRVHLASVGHPVMGDAVYGRGVAGLSRQFLHASALALRHPRGGERVEFRAELPQDLRRYLDDLSAGEGAAI